MHIERCECQLVTFATMKDWCKDRPATTLSDLEREFKCGLGCGLCAPYVRRMLRTGETIFHEIVSDPPTP